MTRNSLCSIFISWLLICSKTEQTGYWGSRALISRPRFPWKFVTAIWSLTLDPSQSQMLLGVFLNFSRSCLETDHRGARLSPRELLKWIDSIFLLGGSLKALLSDLQDDTSCLIVIIFYFRLTRMPQRCSH